MTGAAEPIYFFTKTDPYFELSNFAPYGLDDDGVYWSSVEHYFQAQKFDADAHADYRERIRRARSPKDAKSLGQSRSVPLRADWEEIKEAVMLRALRLKFARAELVELLLGTGARPLVEASPHDAYWGAGKFGQGQNRLGVLLMQVRAELREAAAGR
ncbi:MAG: NADAR family protein [Planctomycetota bacterium]